MYRKKTYRKKPTKRTYKRKSYARKTVKKPLRKMIRAEIARNIENKSKQTYNTAYQLFPSNSTSFPLNVIELGPNPTTLPINQGTGAAGRVGNRIKTKKLAYKGTLVMQPYNAATWPFPQPVNIKLVIFYDRTDPTAVPAVSTDFFQDGGSTAGFTSSAVDLWRPYNTDKYRILTTRNFKLGYASSTGTDSGGTNDDNAQYWANNDYKLNCNFSVDLTKYYPQTVMFNDNSSTPTTRGLFALWYITTVHDTGFQAAWIPCKLMSMQDYVYEDA